MCWWGADPTCGCLPSPHLLPAVKTEGAACSDSGCPSVKCGQKRCQGTQMGGSWGREGKGDATWLGCPLGPSSGQSEEAKPQEREAGVQERRHTGQEEALGGKSCTEGIGFVSKTGRRSTQPLPCSWHHGLCVGTGRALASSPLQRARGMGDLHPRELS